jgi:peptidoglycan/xylan/chitin deacetylase (PgdA/CDA1 family)
VKRLAALSVDLDEVDNYTAIHGLSPALIDGRAKHAIYDQAVPRFAEFFREHDVPATFFAIGRDLARAENRVQLRALAQSGHEIGNHTLNHRYDLTRCTREEQREEVGRGADAIEQAVSLRPLGFRAPGYTVTEQLLEVVASEGARYDSSVFPCPPYYGAKSVAMSLIALRGGRSKSILDHPRVLTAPADPYRMGRSYRARGAGLIELPVGVTRFSGRFPYLGTFVVLWGEAGARALTRLIVGRPLVNLVLHGIDLSDAESDGLSPLVAHQPDLRRTFVQKRAALGAAVEVLRRAGYTFVTLAEAAKSVA